MTFEDAVKLVNLLGEELSALAVIRDELSDNQNSKHLNQRFIECSRNVDQMILELTQDFGAGSGLDKIKEELRLD